MDDNFYSQHLAKVNESNGVTATEDICNEQGQMLLPTGEPLDQQALNRILKFKLLKPLEDCVAIENQLNEESLATAIEAFMLSDPSIKNILAESQYSEQLKKCCAYANKFSPVMQKLTVLNTRFPSLFNKALFSAWFAMAVYTQHNKDDNDIYDAFIAGLMHDIGMLHLNPEFVKINRKLEPHEWRQLQAHPLISLQVVKNIAGLSQNICTAVADHHECIDGTGYPAAKVSKQISSLAQILHLLDSCYAIYEKNFKPKQRTLCDLTPIIQMNQHYRDNPYASVLIMLFKSALPTSECVTPPEFVDGLIDYVQEKNNFVINFLQKALKLNDIVGYTHNDKKLIGIQNILLHINICLTRSGLIDSAYIDSLELVKTNSVLKPYREIEDVSIMLSEIIHHCNKFKLYLKLYVQDCKDSNFKNPLATLSDNVESLPIPKPAKNFVTHFMELHQAEAG